MRKLEIPKGIRETIGLNGQEAKNIGVVDFFENSQEISKLMLGVAVGPGRCKYRAIERRSLYLPVGDIVVKGFISIIPCDGVLDQEPVETAVYDFCVKTKASKLIFYYVPGPNRQLVILNACPGN